MKKYEKGTPKIDPKYKIVIEKKGPYMVYGRPPINTYTIVTNEAGNSWDYKVGAINYVLDIEPTALCRCGRSKNKPYCDGSHIKVRWDSALTASRRSLLESAEVYEGPDLIMTDNERYCAYARFCEAKGRAWNLVDQSDDQKKKEIAIRESNLCPAGRLKTWDKKTGDPYELHYEPAIGLIEDAPLHNSGGLWVMGGIPVVADDGFIYEVRNRVALCRCGFSQNKPFCDGTHTTAKLRDGLKK